MTGHNNSIQNQTPTFLTTLQSTLNILDDISGSIEERQALEPLFQQVGHKVTDVCGKLNLNEFMGL